MGETGTTGGSRGSGSWSRQAEDLSKQWALEQCESVEFEGVHRPYVGKTALLAELGRGGMGIVYFGVNPRLNTEVAIKVLPIRIQHENAESVERFVREARLAAQLQSPHLVRVLDVDKDEKSGAHYIVMEYVRGKSAREWMDEFKLEKGAPEKEALEVAIATTKGLKAAHMEGILHRDVKPHNILIPSSDAGNLQLKHSKLADLGLARHESSEDEITSTQMGMGTPGYTSAEQATDARSATKRSDVFGVGATLYALLTKKRPYQGKNPVDIVINTMKGKYKRIREVRPDVSKGTAALLEKCLSVEPDDRFADAAALLQALRVCYRSLTQPAQAGSAAVEQAVIKLVTRKERGKRIAAARRAGPRRTPGRPLAPMRRRRQSSNSGILIGFIVVGLMAAAYMLMKGVGGSTDGTIYVASTPSGATVLIDGEVRGVTPLTVDGLSGAYDVQVRLEGYTTHTQRAVQVLDGARVNIVPSLQKEQQRDAGMMITSTPPDARVWIDGGRERGKTPLFVPGLAYGSHTVEISLDGYTPYKRSHTVKQGEETKVDHTLIRVRSSLTLTGGPPSATVTLVWKGRTTNLALDASGNLTTDLRGGTYTLTITHKGYEPYTRSIKIGEKLATHTLKMVPGKGKLTIDSVPTDCEVLIDGKRIGKTPLRGVIVASGPRKIAVRHPDYSEYERDIDIAVGEALDLGSIKLLGTCTIDFGDLPSDVIAMIDGLQVTNGDRIRLGKHTLVLTRPGHSTQEFEVHATPGKPIVVQPDAWIRPQARLDVHPLPAGAKAFLNGKDVTGAMIVRYKPEQIVLKITRPGYESVTLRRTLVMGRTLKLPEDIKWKKIETYLDLLELPAGSQLVINRKRYGHRDLLPPGNHAVRLEIRKRKGPSFSLNIVSQETARPVLPMLKAKAVKQALEWFKAHQDANGNWGSQNFIRHCKSTRCTGASMQPCDAGVSGLAVLCFLRAGHTHKTGDYKDVVRRGLSALIKRQLRSGGLGMRGIPYYSFNHGYAALALIEAYRLTQDEELWIQAQKAVEFTLSQRTKDLGWRYRMGGGESDTSVTGLMVHVLKTAEAAGLDVEQPALGGALAWIKRMTDPNDGRIGYLSRGGLSFRRQGFETVWPLNKTEAMTALGNVARLMLGARVDDEEVKNGAKLCLASLPRWWYSAVPVDLVNRGVMGGGGQCHIDQFYWYYGSLLAYHVGGSHQKKWDKALRKALLRNQHTKGSMKGSWDPYGPHGLMGGRIYSTAMCCLALEWGYRAETLK